MATSLATFPVLLVVVLLCGTVHHASALSSDLSTWTEGEVLLWLEDEGFGKDIVETFRSNHIDGTRLLIVTMEDLIELKIPRIDARFILEQRTRFSTRRMIDVDGRICVRTQWYWRLWSELLFLFIKFLSGVLVTLGMSVLLKTKEHPGINIAVKVFVIGLQALWIYLYPGQDFQYWLCNLYIVDSTGHLASIITTGVRSLITIAPFYLSGKISGGFFLLNMAIWFLVGDPIQDLVMGTTVCAFE